LTLPTSTPAIRTGEREPSSFPDASTALTRWSLCHGARPPNAR
jgi:hypothetical protein